LGTIDSGLKRERDFYKQRMETDQRVGLAVTKERDKLRKFTSKVIEYAISVDHPELLKLALENGLIAKKGNACDFGDCDCMFKCNETPVYATNHTTALDKPLVGNETTRIQQQAKEWLAEKTIEEMKTQNLKGWAKLIGAALLLFTIAAYFISPESF
jgi:hypothetical protein